MLPLPWIIISPLMIVYTVRNESDLDALADLAGVPRSNFKQLVGKNKNSTEALPQHKGGWQVKQKLNWIRRDGGAGFGPAVPPTPVVGASGEDFIKTYSDVINDPHINGKLLWRLANGGTYYVRAGMKSTEHKGWSKCEPPTDAMRLLVHADSSTRWAPHQAAVSQEPR